MKFESHASFLCKGDLLSLGRGSGCNVEWIRHEGLYVCCGRGTPIPTDGVQGVALQSFPVVQSREFEDADIR